jgi:hypothetical protein
MIEFALDPVVALLLVKPSLGKSRSTEGAPALLKQLGHRESVLALLDLDSQPRLKPD